MLRRAGDSLQSFYPVRGPFSSRAELESDQNIPEHRSPSGERLQREIIGPSLTQKISTSA